MNASRGVGRGVARDVGGATQPIPHGVGMHVEHPRGRLERAGLLEVGAHRLERGRRRLRQVADRRRRRAGGARPGRRRSRARRAGRPRAPAAARPAGRADATSPATAACADRSPTSGRAPAARSRSARVRTARAGRAMLAADRAHHRGRRPAGHLARPPGRRARRGGPPAGRRRRLLRVRHQAGVPMTTVTEVGDPQPSAAARDRSASSVSPRISASTTIASRRASHAPRASAACA